MKSLLSAVSALFLSLALGLAVPQVASAQSPLPEANVINDSGGVSATDGLKIWTAYGAFQVQRNGKGQIYPGASWGYHKPGLMQFVLFTEGKAIAWAGPVGFAEVWPFNNSAGNWAGPWTQVSNTLTTPAAGQWRNVEVLQAVVNGRTYQLTVTTDYKLPNQFADVTADVLLPSGVPSAPQLYLAADVQLDGNDFGPGLTNVVDGKRYVVQYCCSLPPSRVGGIMEGGGPSDPGFTSYVEGYWPKGFGFQGEPGPYRGTAYPNTVSATSVDAGLGGHWNLGTTAAGVVTRKAKLYFATILPPPSGFSIGGSISGLSGSVVLQNNAGDDLSVTANGSFTFATKINSGATYAVTVKSQPAGQTCTVTSGTGTATADVTSVVVTCAATAPSASFSLISASPLIVPANGTSTATVTVTVRDGTGTAMSGKTVTLAQGTGTTTISPASALTNASGVATFTVKAATAQVGQYTATVAGVTLDGFAKVFFSAAPIGKSVLIRGPGTAGPPSGAEILEGYLAVRGLNVKRIATGTSLATEDLRNYVQVWDLGDPATYTALSAADITAYVNYMKLGGALFVTGEVQTATLVSWAARNDSIRSLVSAAGGGTLSALTGNVGDQPLVASTPFAAPAAISGGIVPFFGAGLFNNRGTGSLITTVDGGSTGSAAYWPKATMANAARGTLVSVLDINFLANAWTATGVTGDRMQAFTQNLIKYLQDNSGIAPPTDVAVTASFPAAAGAGRTVTGTLTCTNVGSNPAVNVVCSGASLPAGTTGSCSPSSSPLASLASGASIVCNLSVPVAVAGNTTFTLTSYADNDLTPANDAKGVSIAVVDAAADAAVTLVPAASGSTNYALLTNDTVGGVAAVFGTNVGAVTIANNGGLAGASIVNGQLAVPNTAAPGAYTVTYQICAALLATACDTATILVRVPPKAVNDTTTVVLGETLNGSVAANDLVATGSTFAKLSNPTKGTLTFNADGTFVYTPTAAGTDSFTYSVCLASPNQAVCSGTATVSISITFKPPVATNDTVSTNQNDPVTVTVTSNDVAGQGTTLDTTTLDLDPATPGVQTILTLAGQGTFLRGSGGAVTFTPVTGYIGAATIPYVISDATGQLSNAANFTVNVILPNPIANDDTASTQVSTAVEIDELANDLPATGNSLPRGSTPVDLDPATPGIQTSRNTADGTWAISGPGKITFSPCVSSGLAAGSVTNALCGSQAFSGTATLTYTVTDSGGKVSAPGTITVTASGSVVPVAVNDSGSGTPGSPVTINVIANDLPGKTSGTPHTIATAAASIDLDPSTPGVQATFTSAAGAWKANSDGSATFTPVLDFNGSGKPFTGTTTLSYTVTDSAGGVSNIATVTVTVNPNAVVAANDAVTAAAGTVATILPAANDSALPGATLQPGSVDLDPVTAGIQAGPITVAEGTWLVTDSAGTVTFTPASGFVGVATREYAISDNLGNTAVATISVTSGSATSNLVTTFAGFPAVVIPGATVTGTVTCKNEGPAAASDAVCAVSGLPAGATITCSPASPQATLAVNGTISCAVSYTAPASGSTSIAVAASSANASSSSDNAPSLAIPVITAFDDAIIVRQASSGTSTQSILANDTVGSATAAVGTNVVLPTITNAGGLTGLSINASGQLVVPVTAPLGSYTLTYQVCSSATPASCASASVVLEVAPPLGSTLYVSFSGFAPALPGGTVNGTVTCTNAGPGDASNAACTPSGLPAGATVNCTPSSPQAILAAGSSIVCAVSYTSPSSGEVVVSASATATNNTSSAAQSTGSVTVPIGAMAMNVSTSTAFNTPVGGVLAGASTPAGATFSLLASPTNGTATVNANGTWSYTPAAGFTGVDSFTYRLCLAPPSDTTCETGTVTVTVAPGASDGVMTVPANGSTSGTLVGTGTVAGSTFSVVNNGTNGLAVLNANGTYTYTPRPGFAGVDRFTYQVCLPAPNQAICSQSTVPVVVTPDAKDLRASTMMGRSVVLDPASAAGAAIGTGSTVTVLSGPSQGAVTVSGDGTLRYVPNPGFAGVDQFSYRVCLPAPNQAACDVANAIVDVRMDPASPIPTLSAWTALLMLLILSLVGRVALRRGRL